MKFVPFLWTEVFHGFAIQAQGVFHLRASAPCALYGDGQGVQALVGVASEFEVETSGEVTFTASAPEGTRFFVFQPQLAPYFPTGEVFTNIDRMPDESGSIDEVRRALRLFELEKRQILRDMRADVRAAAQLPADEIVQAVDPVVVVE